MSGSHKVLVYGTLKKGYGNNYLLGTSPMIRDGSFAIPNHRLIDSGLPFLVKSSKTSAFFGEVYEVDDEVLASLDALELHPTWYKRTFFKEIDASVYVLQDKVSEDIPTIFSYGSDR